MGGAGLIMWDSITWFNKPIVRKKLRYIWNQILCMYAS